MKNIAYRIISIVTFIIALVCFVAMKTLDGGGFFDLSNLARYGLAVLATVMAIISVMTAMKLKLAKRQEENNKTDNA
ncbi:MAG: hypothetical protein IKU47_03810 [Oscillospiraceae bacterium]|nr:hypothetical protein [Oscillospiraceae bacterium]